MCTKCGPHEKVGVQCLRNGVPAVVEYSDLDPKLAELRNEEGGLVFSAGNVCMHYYSFEFLDVTCHPSRLPSEYHVANKKIPYVDDAGNAKAKCDLEENTGIKLESFIFDVFSAAKNLVVFEVTRAEEFSPVKNAPGSKSDSPDTARELISSQHKKWMLENGASFAGASSAHGSLCEISPLVSYNAEGLSAAKGKQFPLPLLVLLESEPVDSSVYSRIGTLGDSVALYSRKPVDNVCEVSSCSLL